MQSLPGGTGHLVGCDGRQGLDGEGVGTQVGVFQRKIEGMAAHGLKLTGAKIGHVADEGFPFE